jgi:hypothetical protein
MDQLNVQALEALNHANEIRSARARDKKRIGLEQLDAASIIRDVPDQWRTAKVIDLLVCIPRIGRAKATAWLHMVNYVPAVVPLGKLTERQRFELALLIDSYMLRRQKLAVRSALA